MFDNTSVLEAIALFVSLVSAVVIYMGLRRAVKAFRWMLHERINGDCRRLARSDMWDEAVALVVLVGHFFLSVVAAATPAPPNAGSGQTTAVGLVLVLVHFGTGVLLTYRSFQRVRDRDWYICRKRKDKAVKTVMTGIIKKQSKQIREIADREDGER